jgi:hypothetical protein
VDLDKEAQQLVAECLQARPGEGDAQQLARIERTARQWALQVLAQLWGDSS